MHDYKLSNYTLISDLILRPDNFLSIFMRIQQFVNGIVNILVFM